MPFTEGLYKRRIRLYAVGILTLLNGCFQMALIYFTHSLTLQFALYHWICKLLALLGQIFVTREYTKRLNQIKSIENSKDVVNSAHTKVAASPNGLQKTEIAHSAETNGTNGNVKNTVEENKFIENSRVVALKRKEREYHENKLKNTFGWARINVLGMSIIFIILSSLSFSNIVEAIKMFVHMEHKDTTHCPLPLLAYGAFDLLLNGLCLILIGGYTKNLVCYCKFKAHKLQKQFICDDNLEMTINEINTKPIIIDKNSSESVNEKPVLTMNKSPFNSDEELIITSSYEREGWYDFLSDISTSIFVMICGLSVHIATNYFNSPYAKYIDPILAIFSSTILLHMMFKYMKESCMILLQTIPGSFNIQVFRKNLLMKFSEISVHDLHVWSLTSKNYVATVHIIFKDTQSYLNTIQFIKKYFQEQGITTICIQPEFVCRNADHAPSALHDEALSKKNPMNGRVPVCDECLLSCSAITCAEKSCCNVGSDLKSIVVKSSSLQESRSHSHCHHNDLAKICKTPQPQLEILNVNNLENSLINSSHTITFNHNKVNKSLEKTSEELNGNYKMIEDQNKDSDVIETKNNYNSFKSRATNPANHTSTNVPK